MAEKITLPKEVPLSIAKMLHKQGVSSLRPAQEKAIRAGLFSGNNLLVCTPTASGKTLIAEMAAMNTFFSGAGKCIYVVPLRALANEKYKEFRKKYEGTFRIAVTTGEKDSAENYLIDYDLIICTAEKLDSLLRHHSPWVRHTKVLIVDEIHLLNDPSRGPTLEIIITIMRKLIKDLQVIGLSATIGNPDELSSWLAAELVEDDWRPVELCKGIYHNGRIEFFD